MFGCLPQRLVFVALAAVVSLLPGSAAAAGLILYEIGTYDALRAAAGWSARAEDASTLFTNPAGLSRLGSSDLVVGGHLLYGDLGFEPDAKTTTAGNNGGNPVGALPGGGAYYARRFNDDWSAGIGAFSYFGLAQKFDEGWVGRYYLQEGTLVGLTLMPAISYRIDARLSVGAGLNAMWGVFRQQAAVRNVPQAPDGRLEISDNTFGIGANAGVLFELDGGTRFGATYLSPVSLDFTDTPEFTGLTPLMEGALRRAGALGKELDLGMTVPQTVMASFHHALHAGWALSGNVGWQNWNRFGKVEVAVSDTTAALAVDANYKDTWHAALGGEWAPAPRWLVTAGVAYDSTPVDEAERTLSFAVGETWRFAAGARRKLNDAATLGFGYALAWGGDIALDQSRGPFAGRVSGAFPSTALHFFVISLVWAR